MAPSSRQLLVQAACFGAIVILAKTVVGMANQEDAAVVIQEAYGNYKYERCWKPLVGCRGEAYSFLDGDKDQMSAECCSHVIHAGSSVCATTGALSPIPRSVPWACRSRAAKAAHESGLKQGTEKKVSTCSS